MPSCSVRGTCVPLAAIHSAFVWGLNGRGEPLIIRGAWVIRRAWVIRGATARGERANERAGERGERIVAGDDLAPVKIPCYFDACFVFARGAARR